MLLALEASLDAGHWRVALRRFFLAKGYGKEIPPTLHEQVEDLIEKAPPPIVSQIRSQVEEFLQWLSDKSA